MYNDLINWYNNNTYKSSIKILEFRKICEITSFLDNNFKHITPKQRIWHLINNNFNIQYCEICEKPTNFDRHKDCYKICCSKECDEKFRLSPKWLDYLDKNKTKTKLTCIERYGVDSYSKTNKFKEKFKETCLEKYGVENPSQSNEFKEKSKQTCVEKYGVEYYQQLAESKERFKETCLRKYDVENYSQTDEFKEKSKATNFKKYGVEWYQQSTDFKENFKETCLIKYGVEHYQQSEESKEKSKLINLEKYGVDSYSKTNEFKEKYKETCLEKYGVDSYSKTDESKEKLKLWCLENHGVENISQLPSTITKIHKTKKKNGSYGKSKEEDELYDDLVLLFGSHNVIRQYQDERYYSKNTKYLFACDFYIKSLDLFIEYDGIWTHKPQYLPEKEKLKMLDIWKEKANNGSKYYKNALNAYERDCLKREISKENKLNIQFVPNTKYN